MRTTYTRYYLGVAYKLAVVQFINSTFANFFANVIGASLNDNDTYENLKQYFSASGIIQDSFFLFLSKAFIPPVTTFFNWKWGVKIVTQKLFVKRIIGKRIIQAKANAMFEGLTFDLASTYASVVRNIWFAAFYAALFPLGSVFILIGTVIFFWIQKYILLRRGSFPRFKLSHKLDKTMNSLLEMTSLVFAIGNFLWCVLTGFNTKSFGLDLRMILAWIVFAISILNIMIPEGFLSKVFCFRDDVNTAAEIPYVEAKLDFETNYEIENPITREDAISEGAHQLMECNQGFQDYVVLLLQKHAENFGVNVFKQPRNNRGWNAKGKRITKDVVSQISIYCANKLSIRALGSDEKQKIESQAAAANARIHLDLLRRQSMSLALKDPSIENDIEFIDHHHNPFPRGRALVAQLNKTILNGGNNQSISSSSVPKNPISNLEPKSGSQRMSYWARNQPTLPMDAPVEDLHIQIMTLGQNQFDNNLTATNSDQRFRNNDQETPRLSTRRVEFTQVQRPMISEEILLKDLDTVEL